MLVVLIAPYLLSAHQLGAGEHHTRHFELFGKGTTEINQAILKGVDKVQASAMDGGGYFIGVKANPSESPIGYPLSFLNRNLIEPPRKTSYCSGASYSAFIEGLNLVLKRPPTHDRIEAMRMQELNGGRRDDGVKFWGWWNADGPGSEFALVQYSGAGVRIKPENALPGDFMNISWKTGVGHSVVFLGWSSKGVLFWSSQKGTNGLGDMFSPYSKIKSVVIVRMTNPEAFNTFDINQKVNVKVEGDTLPPSGIKSEE